MKPAWELKLPHFVEPSSGSGLRDPNVLRTLYWFTKCFDLLIRKRKFLKPDHSGLSSTNVLQSYLSRSSITGDEEGASRWNFDFFLWNLVQYFQCNPNNFLTVSFCPLLTAKAKSYKPDKNIFHSENPRQKQKSNQRGESMCLNT
jgi:hypothetical protein